MSWNDSNKTEVYKLIERFYRPKAHVESYIPDITMNYETDYDARDNIKTEYLIVKYRTKNQMLWTRYFYEDSKRVVGLPDQFTNEELKFFDTVLGYSIVSNKQSVEDWFEQGVD